MKHTASSVETRDCWAPILEKNRVRFESTMNDARAMNQLLRNQLSEAERGETLTKSCPPDML